MVCMGGGGLKEILIFPTYFSLPLPVRKEWPVPYTRYICQEWDDLRTKYFLLLTVHVFKHYFWQQDNCLLAFGTANKMSLLVFTHCRGHYTPCWFNIPVSKVSADAWFFWFVDEEIPLVVVIFIWKPLSTLAILLPFLNLFLFLVLHLIHNFAIFRFMHIAIMTCT